MKIYGVYAKVACMIIASGVCVFGASVFAEDTQKRDLSSEQLDFASGLFQRGMYKMASDEYAKFIAQYPADPGQSDACFGLAESYFFQNKFMDACTQFETFLSSFPSDDRAPLAGLRIAESLLALDDAPKALERFNRVDVNKLKEHYKQDHYYYLGKTYESLSDSGNALASLNKSLGILPDSETAGFALLEIGNIYWQGNDKAKASEYYAKAYDATTSRKVKTLALFKKGELQFTSAEYSESAYTFMRLMSEEPNAEVSLTAFSNMLMSLYNIGEYRDLVGEYEKNSAIIPETRNMLDIYYVVISAYDSLAETDKAVALIDKLSEAKWTLDEDKRRLSEKRIGIMLNTGKFDQALKLCEKYDAAFKQSKDYTVFIEAEAKYGLGRYDDAAELYNKVITGYEGSEYTDESIYGLAYCFKEKGDLAKAEEYFLRYFKDGKDDLRKEEALYNVILMDSEKPDIEAAIGHARTFLETFPSGDVREKVLFKLGVLYSDAKDFESAANTLNEFVNTASVVDKMQEAYFLLGYSYQSLGDAEKALMWYSKVDPGAGNKLFYSTLKNMALIYIGKTQDDLAAPVFKRIVEECDDNDLDPDAYLWLAKFYVDKKSYQDALEVVNKYGSEKKKERVKEFSYFKAEALRGLGENREAIKAFDLVLEGAPEGMFEAASLIGRGVCHREMKDYKSAASDLGKAIEDYSLDDTITMRARFELALNKLAEGNVDEAYRLFMLVAILYKDDYFCPESLFQAGQIAESQAKIENAVQAYNEIISKFSGSHVYDKAAERLKVVK